MYVAQARQVFAHNDTLFRLALLAYTCHTVRRFSPFSSRTSDVIDPRTRILGSLPVAAVFTESRRAATARMARRSWIYIVCLGENWFFMRDTWGYLAIHTLDSLSHVPLLLACVCGQAYAVIWWQILRHPMR